MNTFPKNFLLILKKRKNRVSKLSLNFVKITLHPLWGAVKLLHPTYFEVG